MTASDATPAYRGYRLQALYVLFRVSNPSSDKNLVIQPEGYEDLAIFDNGNLIEVVQVKALSDDLKLSDFFPEKWSPGKDDTFFHRINSLLKKDPKPKIVVASFGPIGPELKEACESDCRKRMSVIQKLAKKGFSSEEAEIIIKNLNIVFVSETEIKEQICKIFKDILTGVDSKSAFELLTFWLYKCSENKTSIKKQDIISKINKIGEFLEERRAHHAEWFNSIIPLEDQVIKEQLREELDKQFYQGVPTRYEHVLADLDVRRPQKMEEFNKKFKENRILIVHGASGQGKTTLAYRYLHDFFPHYWRFKIKHVENRKHALRIATALMGHVKAISIPIVVYIDVAPNDNNWPDLVKQLSAHQSINVLVTIREEDWRRASISGAELQFSEMDLDLDHSEAELIYRALIEKRISTEFLDFDDAWGKFGGKGPLMEFIYLITHGQSIKDRLRQQINRLQDEAREKPGKSKEILLLKLVSIASAYQARLKIKPLVDILQLSEPIRTLQLMEKEYLLRFDKERSLVDGVHPIRSAIIADLLTDSAIAPWSDSAINCLPLMQDEDIETFLLFAFSRHKEDLKALLNFISSYHPYSWAAIAGITRALLWLGIREYAEKNESLISELYGQVGNGWIFVLDADISNAIPGIAASILDNSGGLITQEDRMQIELFRSRQAEKKYAFKRAIEWLSLITYKPDLPMSNLDWAGLAETTFWAGRFNIDWQIDKWLSRSDLDRAVESLPLEILANVVVGLHEGYADKFALWIDINYPKIISRLRQEKQFLTIEDDGKNIKVHLIFQFDRLNEVNAVVMDRIWLLRKLIPKRECYASQGYGHRLWSKELLFDESEHRIPYPQFTLEWLTHVNSMFRGYVEQSFRPKDWVDYSEMVIELRRMILRSLKQLEKSLIIYFRSKRYIEFYGKLIDANVWNNYIISIKKPSLLPLCAVDEWGLVDEYKVVQPNNKIENIRKNLAIERYKPFLDGLNNYKFHLLNFYDQSVHTMKLNPLLGRSLNNQKVRANYLELASKQGIKPSHIRSSYFNLSDSLKYLTALQKEFRILFGNFFDKRTLDELEMQERALLSNVLNMWYFFNFHPETMRRDPVGYMELRNNNVSEILLSNIKKELKIFKEFELNIIYKSSQWNNGSALWLFVDGNSLFDIYNSISTLYSAIRKAINQIEDTPLRFSILKLHYESIVIVPLIKGKCPNLLAWCIDSTVLSSGNNEEEIKWWNFAQYPIREDVLRQLGVDLWVNPYTRIGFQLWQSVVELSFLVAHIRDFKRIPRSDEDANKLLLEHIEYIWDSIKKTFALIQGSRAQILEMILPLPTLENNYNQNIINILEALNQLDIRILPTPDFKGEAMLTLDDFAKWANRLEEGRIYALYAYSFWLNEVLDRHS